MARQIKRLLFKRWLFRRRTDRPWIPRLSIAAVSLGLIGLPVAVPKAGALEGGSMNRPLDTSHLVLRGDHCRQDAFSLTIQAAARLLGVEADYETIHALSTNAFALDLRPDEPCRCSWCVQGRGRGIDLVAKALGLSVRILPRPDLGAVPPVPDGAAEKERWFVTYCRKPYIPAIREALDRGEVIVADLEWQAGAFWCDWGIVTDARDDGTILGVTVDGRDRRIAEVRGDWLALSRAKPSLTRREANAAMLRRAVERIRGEGPFAPGIDPAGRRIVYGRAAVTAWIDAMGRVPYMAGSPDASRQTAPCTANVVHHGAETAARTLRRIAPSFHALARAKLEAAARQYDRITVLLDPALSEKGKERYAAFMGDAEAQRRHADTVLRPVGYAMEAAANRIEEALAALEETPGQVVPAAIARTMGRHPIDEALPYIGSGVGIAHVQALRHAGTAIEFDDFAAMSGWAFSFGYDYDNSITASNAVCGRPGLDGPYEVYRWLAERLGYAYDGSPIGDAARFETFVRESIDAGRPLLSEHFDGGLIGGYRTAGDDERETGGAFEVWFNGPVGCGWLRRDQLDPTWVYALRKSSRAMERRRLAREALRRAVAKGSPHEYEGIPQGLAALEAYRRDVADPSKTFEKRSEWFCWATYERLMARRSCAAWLASAARLLPDAREPLLDASRHYRKAFEGYDRFRIEAGMNKPDGGDTSGLGAIAYSRTPERIAVLVPLLDGAVAEERAGIDAMKRALAIVEAAPAAKRGTKEAAKRIASVKREKNAARIENVPAPTWATDKITTFIGCLEAATAVTDHPVSYETLMGLTGLATRIRWYTGDNGRAACPSAAVGEFPEEIAAVARAGWTLKQYALENAAKADREAARLAFVASIDAGRPVLVYPDWNVAVADGYEDEGRILLARDYHRGETIRLPFEKAGAFLWVLDRWESPGDPREVLLASLVTAARNAVRESLPFNAGRYAYGDAAFGQWIERLETYDTLPDDRRQEIDGANEFVFGTLADARRSAAAFLRDAARRLPKGRASLKRAARLCEREAKALRRTEIAGPDRSSILAALKDARPLDADAIAEIRNALRAEGIGPISGQALSAGREAPREVLLDRVRKEWDVLPDDGRYFNNRFTSLLCRMVLLRAAGVETDYETLDVLSGHGASFAYHPVRYQPLYQPPDSPEETESRIAAATGIAFAGAEAKDPEAAWSLVRKALDGGRAAQGAWLDDLIFAGYRDAERPEDREVYVLGGWDRPGWWPWARFAEWAAKFGRMSWPADPAERVPPRESAVEVLRGIVRYAAGDGRANVEWMAHARYGLAGMEAYAGDIADLSRAAGDWDGGWLGCHCAYRQILGRRCMADLLRRWAGEFDGTAQRLVVETAKAYEQAWEDWTRWGRQLGQDTGLTGAADLAKLWSDSERRKAGAAAILDAIAHEARAVEKAREALAAIENAS